MASAAASRSTPRASTSAPPQGLAFAGRGILTQRDAKVMEHLEQIDVPTLLVWGADDERYQRRYRIHGREDPRTRAR